MSLSPKEENIIAFDPEYGDPRDFVTYIKDWVGSTQNQIHAAEVLGVKPTTLRLWLTDKVIPNTTTIMNVIDRLIQTV